MERVHQQDNESANRRHVAQGKSTAGPQGGEFAKRINNSPAMMAQRRKLNGMFGSTIQMVEEEEPLQGKFAITQMKHELGEEEFLPGRYGTTQRMEEEEPLQGKFEAASPAQLMDGDSDSSWEEESNDAPDGYMDPTDYRDEFGGSDHSNLDGTVWAARIQGRPALWWQNPYEETRLRLRGSRPRDIAALGGDDGGYTWHHCADYQGGYCTMQQVPTYQHGSWGHIGGASQAGYGEDG